MIEVEKRYKVYDVDDMRARLERAGIHEIGKKHIIDEWYAPQDVQSHEHQLQWFDREHGVAYRIRQTEQPDGTFVVKVESKQLTSADNHDTFNEKTLEFAGYKEALHYMKGLGYWNWLTIDKTRLMFDSGDPEIEIIMDHIAGMAEKIGVGAALEVEYVGESERDDALRKLGTFASKFGLSDDRLFEKSFTVEAMQVLAKFD